MVKTANAMQTKSLHHSHEELITDARSNNSRLLETRTVGESGDELYCLVLIDERQGKNQSEVE
jgi:hypothetical protein